MTDHYGASDNSVPICHSTFRTANPMGSKRTSLAESDMHACWSSLRKHLKDTPAIMVGAEMLAGKSYFGKSGLDGASAHHTHRPLLAQLFRSASARRTVRGSGGGAHIDAPKRQSAWNLLPTGHRRPRGRHLITALVGTGHTPCPTPDYKNGN
jgi:hypothetical protein